MKIYLPARPGGSCGMTDNHSRDINLALQYWIFQPRCLNEDRSFWLWWLRVQTNRVKQFNVQLLLAIDHVYIDTWREVKQSPLKSSVFFVTCRNSNQTKDIRILMNHRWFVIIFCLHQKNCSAHSINSFVSWRQKSPNFWQTSDTSELSEMFSR